jgi:hypothetical protein
VHFVFWRGLYIVVNCPLLRSVTECMQINSTINTSLECCGICNVCVFSHSLQEANLCEPSVQLKDAVMFRLRILSNEPHNELRFVHGGQCTLKGLWK